LIRNRQPRRLEDVLQRHRPSEEQRREKDPRRPPSAQDHDRDRDEPAARGHPLRERSHLREHQARPRDAGECAGHDGGAGTDRADPDTHRAGGHRTLAGRPQRQPVARTVEPPPRDRDGDERRIRRHRLAEERRPDERHRGEPGYRNRREGGNRKPGTGRTERLVVRRAGQPHSTKRDRRPGDDLVGTGPDRDQREDHGERDARREAGRESRPRAARRRSDRSGERSRQHRAFDAQIDHARALGDQLAGRGEQERCRDPYGSSEKSCD
jgi:hypothetical protein